MRKLALSLGKGECELGRGRVLGSGGVRKKAAQTERNSHVGPGDLSSEAHPPQRPPEPARHTSARPHGFWISY